MPQFISVRAGMTEEIITGRKNAEIEQRMPFLTMFQTID
jgi:hypothetical protein